MTRNPLYRIPLECLPAHAASEPFRIYFEELPEPMLNLLLFILFPGHRIRHKLGYGKAFGYGSIAFELVTEGENAEKIRENRDRPDDPDSITTVASRYQQLKKLFAAPTEMMQEFVRGWLRKQSLTPLAKILWYEEPLRQIFTYPAFDKNAGYGFLPIIRVDSVKKYLDPTELALFENNKPVPMDKGRGKKLAENLRQEGARTALHFRIYQDHAERYALIDQRRFE